MTERISQLNVEEIQAGYRLDPEDGQYCCLLCGQRFSPGEIYPMGEKLYDAAAAVRIHIQMAHGSVLEALLSEETRYLKLTERQIACLRYRGEGKSDAEIARLLGVQSATIRHMWFTMREKARQAKLFLAVFELAAKREEGRDAIVEPHPGAVMLDDRYLVTQEERKRILENAFSGEDPLSLARIPAKEKKKIVILSRISEEFQTDCRYTEREMNERLQQIYPDYVTLRRLLIEYGFFARKADGSAYWKVSGR